MIDDEILMQREPEKQLLEQGDNFSIQVLKKESNNYETKKYIALQFGIDQNIILIKVNKNNYLIDERNTEKQIQYIIEKYKNKNIIVANFTTIKKLEINNLNTKEQSESKLKSKAELLLELSRSNTSIFSPNIFPIVKMKLKDNLVLKNITKNNFNEYKKLKAGNPSSTGNTGSLLSSILSGKQLKKVEETEKPVGQTENEKPKNLFLEELKRKTQSRNQSRAFTEPLLKRNIRIYSINDIKKILQSKNYRLPSSLQKFIIDMEEFVPINLTKPNNMTNENFATIQQKYNELKEKIEEIKDNLKKYLKFKENIEREAGVTQTSGLTGKLKISKRKTSYNEPGTQYGSEDFKKLNKKEQKEKLKNFIIPCLEKNRYPFYVFGAGGQITSQIEQGKIIESFVNCIFDSLNELLEKELNEVELKQYIINEFIKKEKILFMTTRFTVPIALYSHSHGEKNTNIIYERFKLKDIILCVLEKIKNYRDNTRPPNPFNETGVLSRRSSRATNNFGNGAFNGFNEVPPFSWD